MQTFNWNVAHLTCFMNPLLVRTGKNYLQFSNPIYLCFTAKLNSATMLADNQGYTVPSILIYFSILYHQY